MKTMQTSELNRWASRFIKEVGAPVVEKPKPKRIQRKFIEADSRDFNAHWDYCKRRNRPFVKFYPRKGRVHVQLDMWTTDKNLNSLGRRAVADIFLKFAPPKGRGFDFLASVVNADLSCCSWVPKSECKNVAEQLYLIAVNPKYTCPLPD